MTHHFEVFSTTFSASIGAGKQHVLDVVARSVIEFTHVEGARLIAFKVRPFLQDLEDIFLDQVWISDLVPGQKIKPHLIRLNKLIFIKKTFKNDHQELRKFNQQIV